MPPPTIKAVTLDAYGTLVRNEDLLLVPRQIVADHGLSVAADHVWREWSELYHQRSALPPFLTLRELEGEILTSVLRQLGIDAAPTAYVDLFFQVTTRVELYPEALEVLAALPPVRAAVVSNADQEHVAAWTFALPVEFVLISEHARSYKPDRLIFELAVRRLGLAPHEVLHVGDSEVDDVRGAKAAGLRVAWVNRTGRARRPDTPAPDFEIRDLTELPALLRN